MSIETGITLFVFVAVIGVLAWLVTRIIKDHREERRRRRLWQERGPLIEAIINDDGVPASHKAEQPVCGTHALDRYHLAVLELIMRRAARPVDSAHQQAQSENPRLDWFFIKGASAEQKYRHTMLDLRFKVEKATPAEFAQGLAELAAAAAELRKVTEELEQRIPAGPLEECTDILVWGAPHSYDPGILSGLLRKFWTLNHRQDPELDPAAEAPQGVIVLPPKPGDPTVRLEKPSTGETIQLGGNDRPAYL
jgi:hypothetical protein